MPVSSWSALSTKLFPSRTPSRMSEGSNDLSHEATVALPLDAIHLDQWLFTLPEADYSACARGHRAVGTNGARISPAW